MLTQNDALKWTNAEPAGPIDLENGQKNGFPVEAFDLTRHAVARMAQRGVGWADMELVQWIGTEVEGGYLVREKDFQALDRELKSLRNRARRLVGKRIVIDGKCVVTAYHRDRAKRRRLLRNAERRSLRNQIGLDWEESK